MFTEKEVLGDISALCDIVTFQKCQQLLNISIDDSDFSAVMRFKWYRNLPYLFKYIYLNYLNLKNYNVSMLLLTETTWKVMINKQTKTQQKCLLGEKETNQNKLSMIKIKNKITE